MNQVQIEEVRGEELFLGEPKNRPPQPQPQDRTDTYDPPKHINKPKRMGSPQWHGIVEHQRPKRVN